jgi:hypothetical protein
MNKKLEINNTEMSPNKTARIAGFLFLILGICTGASWAYLKSIYVPNDALTTVNNIQASGSILLLSGGYLSAFGATQLNALIMLFLDLHIYGVYIAGIFWGLWLFPLGFLVFKSGFIPKTIGVFLIIAGFGYIIDSLFRFLIPGYNMEISSYTFIGELMIIFWLLFKGVNVQESDVKNE